MRAIGEGEERQQRNQKMARNFAIFFLGMLVISSIGYAFLSNPDVGTDTSTDTTNSGVRQIGDRWVFGQSGRQVSMAYSPTDVANISVLTTSTLADYAQEPLFFDIENQGILSEMSSALAPYPSRVQEACYGSCSRDLPEKGCTENIIVFRENETNSVSQQDKCIFINGDLRAADAYLYDLFGISPSQSI